MSVSNFGVLSSIITRCFAIDLIRVNIYIIVKNLSKVPTENINDSEYFRTERFGIVL